MEDLPRLESLEGHLGRTRVKICGLTRPEDAWTAAVLGADALGVVFARSPRYVDFKQAVEILDAAPLLVNRVGVFADQPAGFVWDAVIACRLDWVQLHGSEAIDLPAGLPARVIRSVGVDGDESIRRAAEYPADAYMLDAPPLDWRKGGTGRTFDWSLAADLPWPRRRVIVAGGLTSQNVGEAIARFRPGAVDVSSGVESEPRIKDAGKIEAFMTAVIRADAQMRDDAAGAWGEEGPEDD